MKVALLSAIAAVGIAGGSCAIQQHGPDQAIYCALGKSRDGYDIYCPKPVLNGGWPAPFAFDRPGISVEDKIAFPEDDFRFWPFVSNVAFYLLIILSLMHCLRRLRAEGARPVGREENSLRSD